MSKSDKHIPTVAINNVPRTSSMSSITEDRQLKDRETYRQDAHINDEDDDDDDTFDNDSVTGHNKIKNIMAAKNDGEEMIGNQDSPTIRGGDIMACLHREMSDYQEMQDDMTNEYEEEVRQAETEDDLLQASDPELLRRTESNRHIPYEEVVHIPTTSNTIHGQSDQPHKDLLVFSDNPTVIEEPTKLRVVQYYGAGKSGILPVAYRSKRRPKSYLVACDFSKESLYAIEWAMGTMMRDGDEIDIATVVNRDDNPNVAKKDLKGELQAISDALITETKKLLEQMMLFNIKLVTHAIIGRVNYALKSLTREHDYTMLICGSRGRGSIRTLLMGSVSTYLIHKSLVPVAVIHIQEKKKRVKHHVVEAQLLSESVKSGHLHVDELS